MEPQGTDLDITTFLVASIHDMKNSLSVMNALLEDAVGLVEDTDSPAGKQLGQALYESERINDNLIQLVALYKINEKFYPFDALEHDVADFADETIARVAPLARLRDVRVRHDCPPGLLWYFDRELIFGAVVQALRNGLRYTRSQVQLSVMIEDDMLKFRVEDDGPGYPPHMLVAQPNPGQGISFATGSTGLGLYFSTVIARLHHNRGRIGMTRLDNGGALGGGLGHAPPAAADGLMKHALRVEVRTRSQNNRTRCSIVNATEPLFRLATQWQRLSYPVAECSD